MLTLLLALLLVPAGASAAPEGGAAAELAAQLRAGYAARRSTQPATLAVAEFTGQGGTELSYLLRVKLSTDPFSLLHPGSVEASSADLRISGAVFDEAAVTELWDANSGQLLASAASPLEAPPPPSVSTAPAERRSSVWTLAGPFLRGPTIGAWGSVAWRTRSGRWEAAVDAGGFNQETWDDEDHGSFGHATSHYSQNVKFFRAKAVHILPADAYIPGLSLRAGAGLGAYILDETRIRRSDVRGLDSDSMVRATYGALLFEAGLAYRLANWLEAQAGVEYASEGGSRAAHQHYGRFSAKGGLAARLFPSPGR